MHRFADVQALKPFQAEALSVLKQDRHVICSAPTGSGKTRIITERLLLKERALIVSPLIALERQHSQNFEFLGLRRGFDFEIVSPEKLQKSGDRIFQDLQPRLFVVDECHCVPEWGKSFRPEFLEVPKWMVKKNFKKSLWLSATLSFESRAYLKNHLPEKQTWLGSFALPENLTVRVLSFRLVERLQWLIWFLSQTSGNGLIFVSQRSTAERLSRLVEGIGYRASAYHAGMAFEERIGIERKMNRGELKVTIGTNALGLGMDIQTFDWVIVFEPPHSMTDLAQMVGRVGRNKKKGTAWVLWSEEDQARLLFFAGENRANSALELQRDVFRFLKKVRNFGFDLENWFKAPPSATPHSVKKIHERD